MKKGLAVALPICLVYAPALGYAATPASSRWAAALAQDQDEGAYQPYSPEQLENLLAPIALYPDPLLARVLPAATFPDQIDQAAQYVAANGQYGVDDQPWDVSVKAVAHYPSILTVINRTVNYNNIGSYTSVHNNVTYNNRATNNAFGRNGNTYNRNTNNNAFHPYATNRGPQPEPRGGQFQPQLRGQAPHPQARPERPAGNRKKIDRGEKGGKSQEMGRHPGF